MALVFITSQRLISSQAPRNDVWNTSDSLRCLVWWKFQIPSQKTRNTAPISHASSFLKSDPISCHFWILPNELQPTPNIFLILYTAYSITTSKALSISKRGLSLSSSNNNRSRKKKVLLKAIEGGKNTFYSQMTSYQKKVILYTRRHKLAKVKNNRHRFDETQFRAARKAAAVFQCFSDFLVHKLCRQSPQTSETLLPRPFPIPCPKILLSETFKQGPLIRGERKPWNSSTQTRNKEPVGGVKLGRHYVGQWPAPLAPRRRPRPWRAGSEQTTGRGRNPERQNFSKLGSGKDT